MKTAASLTALRAPKILAAIAAGLLTLSISGAAALAQDAAPTPVAPATVTSDVAPIAVGANLNISPKRLTFDRSGRSATVYIYNQGDTPATFDIALVDRVMTPSGQISAVADVAAKPELAPFAAKLKSAQPMLLATPRRATLAPGKGQTIRVRVNPGAEAAGLGEYRSHLTVTTIPPRDLGMTAEQASKPGSQELSFLIHSVFGISIPVIVRLGDADVRGAIENTRFSYENISPNGGAAPAVRTPVLSFDLARLGASSLFGNLEVKGAKGKEPIGLARGVGVYTEIDRRNVQLPLTRAPAPGETLEITFSDDDTSPGRVVARSAFTAP
jgi:P pilus assembly chaperone PapD